MEMGGNYLIVVTVYTVISLLGLSWRINWAVKNVLLDSSIAEKGGHPGQATQRLELLLSSYVTVALLANFVFNIFILVTLCLKIIFFGQLSSIETRKVVERVINYVVYKGIFLPLVVQPDIFHAALWSTWFSVLCFLKMFQALARDRLERLNASPSATPWTYFRVFSVLLWVLSVDLFWMRLCMVTFKASGSSTFLLLLFEPLSIAFETLQAIMVHGFQLIETWHCNSVDSNRDYQGSQLSDKSAAGSLWEWKGILLRNCGFFLDLMTLSMALGHYLHIWWLHGMAFHLVDAVLFLNSRALVSAILKRIKGFIKLRTALSTLQGALPDATSEELREYNDECAICREPMARAKKLSCNHLFHLSCLRSWLDQGQNEMYSCPTCRRPLFVGSPIENSNSLADQVLDDEQLARQISAGMDHRNLSGHVLPTGPFPNQQPNPSGSMWRGVGLDPSWGHPWPGTGLDGAGPSTVIRTVGFGRVQMMMRHLTSFGETYAHTALDDTAWSLWPMAHPQAGPSSSIPPVRHNVNTSSLRFRNPSPPGNENVSGILAMADTVREVLPHIPDQIIFQDLQRTNSVAVTVNNLLQL